MLQMRIETLYRDHHTREWKELRPAHVTAKHGWQSAADYVAECSKRFKHRDPKPYGNGIEMRGDVGTLQRITFIEA